jgi:glycerophosphoryl diester phosphodiesterase
VIEGNRIAELKDVFQLEGGARAKKVRFNIETKVEDGRSGGEGMAAQSKAVVTEFYTPAGGTAPYSRSTGPR